VNLAESTALLRETLDSYRARPVAELKRLLDESDRHELTGPSGTRYQVSVQAFWDDRPQGNLRVAGAIDDGGWRAFRPVCDAFIVAPDGSFVGEIAPAGAHAARVRGPEARFARFVLGGGLAGLGAWCFADLLYVKYSAARDIGGGYLIAFAVVLFAAALFHFRGATAGVRVVLSSLAMLLACVAAIGLILLVGIPFHLWIGGRL
jgi:hypothetical protein